MNVLELRNTVSTTKSAKLAMATRARGYSLGVTSSEASSRCSWVRAEERGDVGGETDRRGTPSSASAASLNASALVDSKLNSNSGGTT